MVTPLSESASYENWISPEAPLEVCHNDVLMVEELLELGWLEVIAVFLTRSDSLYDYKKVRRVDKVDSGLECLWAVLRNIGSHVN